MAQTPSPIKTNADLNISLNYGSQINLLDKQQVTLKEIAKYTDSSSNSPVVDTFIRIGDEGGTTRLNGAKIEITTSSGTEVLAYGRTLRINNGLNRIAVGSERVIVAADPLAFIMDNVRIIDGDGGVTDKIYMNLSDKNGTAYKSGTFFINVTSASPNLLPPVVVTPITGPSWREGSNGSFTVPQNTFRDPDSNNALIYSATLANTHQNLPDWLTFNASTRMFSGIPPTGTPDTTIELKATDSSGLWVTTNFTILTPAAEVVLPHPPEVAAPIADYTATEGTVFSYAIANGTFTDSDPGDRLTYTALQRDSANSGAGSSDLPDWLSFNAATMTFTGTPPVEAANTLIEVKATDLTGKSVSTTFTLFTSTGVSAEHSPVLKAPISDLTATEGTAFSFIIPDDTFQDPDPEDTLTYTVKRRASANISDGYLPFPSWLTYDPTTRTLSGTPTPDTLDFLIEVTGTDSTGKVATTNFTILTPSAPAPTVKTGTDNSETLTGTSLAESFFGLGGNDLLQGGGGNDIFDGGLGVNIAQLGATGGSVTVTNIDTLVGGAGVDVVTLNGVAGVRSAIRLSAVETLTGGSAVDIPFLSDEGATISVANLDYLIGGAGTDVVTLGGTGGLIIVRDLETLTGGGNLDMVVLGDGGNSMFVKAGLEYLIGGVGTDVVTLGSGGSTMVVRGLETLTGGAGNDFLKLGDSFNVLKLSGFETLAGGFGTDIPFLGDSGSTLLVSGLEYLIGGTGTDVVTLAGGGVITVRGLETITGGTGIDIVFLGDGGNTMLAKAGIEFLIGGAATDVVTLGSGGTTMTTRGLETIIGGSGVDALQLGNSINTLTVTGVETLVGGFNNDTVTVSGTTSLRFEGGSGGDKITLAANQGIDRVVFRTVNDGAFVGTNVNYDTVVNFGGLDSVVLTGQIAGFVDNNGNGSLQGASRGQNQVNLTTDEAVVLTQQLNSLVDADFLEVRTAVGKIGGTSAGTSVMALAHDASNSALYMLTDADGDGWLAGNEVRLLGVFAGAPSIGLSQLTIA